MRKVFLVIWSIIGSVFFAALLCLINLPNDANAQNHTQESVNKEIVPVEALEPASITLPYRVDGTDLFLHSIVAYEGPFLEDYSNREVVDVAALILENTGTQTIRSALIKLHRGSFLLEFQVSFIPSGKKVLVLERSAQRCLYQNFTSCEGIQILSGDDWLTDGQLKIERVGMQQIRIRNLTERTQDNLRLYFKNYQSEMELYIGGVTGQQALPQILPGDSVTVSVYKFLWDYSQIIGIARERQDVCLTETDVRQEGFAPEMWVFNGKNSLF